MADTGYYSITPKGMLALQLMESFDQLLKEQREELSHCLMEAAAAAQAKDTNAFAEWLADALCICGFKGRNGDD